MSMFRLNVNIDSDLMKEVDAYAFKFRITRSAALNLLLTRALQQEKVIDSFIESVNVLKDGNVDGNV